MERKIGEIFEYNGEWYQCVYNIHGNCDICSFSRLNSFEYGSVCCESYLVGIHGKCGKVIFKKLEKVGEPYEFDGHLFQSYRTFEVPIFTENYATVRELGNNSKISIEIKQNEDMEDRKQAFKILVGKYFKGDSSYDDFEKAVKELYSDKKDSKPTLKEFDLEAAKSGKPVCTRDGRKARIICFDRDWDMRIVALVSDPLGESVHYYLSNGKVDFDRQLDDDLMMPPEKKEGWINVYKMKESTFGYITAYFDTEEKAKEDKEQLTGYVATVKINWEE